MHPGKLFRQAILKNHPLPILGVIDAYAAKLAEHAGAKALYLSGAGVANADFGLPDLALTSMSEVVEATQRITSACTLPLLVDIDTGFGTVLNIQRTVKMMERAGAAALQIEDQFFSKRCGHRDGKKVVSAMKMVERIRAAVHARLSDDLLIMARTDALNLESKEQVLERCMLYIEHGADMIFLEAIEEVSDLEYISQHLPVPVLVNSTEFGKTPIQSQTYWHEHGASMVLYPLSAFRAASKATLEVFQTILATGTQASLISKMQTRQELYQILNYEQDEKQLEQMSGEEHD